MTKPPQFFVIGRSLEVVVNAQGQPLMVEDAAQLAPCEPDFCVKVAAHLSAAYVDESQLLAPGSAFLELFPGAHLAHPVSVTSCEHIDRAVGLVRNRALNNFHPLTGEPLSYTAGNIVGRTEDGAEVFPRLDPAVIGCVTRTCGARGEEELLLGARAGRPGVYSLPAGYVDVGENLEQAFAREVLEETGFQARDVRLWGSQPWPISGSLMVGLVGVCHDVHPVGDTDGELEDVRWFSRRELAELEAWQLPREGSIARRMIEEWLARGA